LRQFPGFWISLIQCCTGIIRNGRRWGNPEKYRNSRPCSGQFTFGKIREIQIFSAEKFWKFWNNPDFGKPVSYKFRFLTLWFSASCCIPASVYQVIFIRLGHKGSHWRPRSTVYCNSSVSRTFVRPNGQKYGENEKNAVFGLEMRLNKPAYR